MPANANASAAEQTLMYRGDLRGIAACGELLFLISAHPEGQPLELIRLDVDKGLYESTPLGGGGVFVAVHGDRLFFGVDEGTVYWGGVRDKRFRGLAGGLEPAAIAIVPLSQSRWGVLSGERVLILNDASDVLQELTLEERGTALASSPDGRWLVVGTERGTVAVYECESPASEGSFTLSEAAQLHSGQVTALAFDPDELRFYSAGTDNKLLLTHARGRLEPEDRGGNGNHDKPITALLVTAGERFYTGSQDRTLKAWQRGSNRRPQTLKEGTGASIGLAIVQVNGRPHLAQACDDNTVRLFPLDAEGKLGERSRLYRGAMDWAKQRLARKEVRDRKGALEQLAAWNDSPSIDLLAERAEHESDHELKVLATTLLGDSGNPRAIKHLERLLRAGQEAVRMKALAGLRKLEGESSLRPLQLALEVGKADIGQAAVRALQELAGENDQAATLLVQALEKSPYTVRSAALKSLEALHPSRSPAGDLRGLRSRQADIRQLALVRLYQRKLLDLPEVQAALRQHSEDPDAGVRQVAFLVSVIARPKLAGILRSLDPELHRQLHELEQSGTRGQPKDPPALKPKPIKGLKTEDFAPLLQAMSSRALDTCLRGAWGLALLGDPRAFGTLLQLSRERDAAARRDTCKALQRLGDRRAIDRLRMMLRDKDMAVRDAAFSALAELRGDAPLAVAEAGLAAEHEDIRKRGLHVLVEHLSGIIQQEGEERARAVSLLGRAMNDSAEPVRREAFKAALNLRVGGDEPETLRYILQSLHSDIRLEVLTEAMSQVARPWAWGLLLELLDDPDAYLREEAFDFALKKGRGAKRSEVLQRALLCSYVDLRLKAADALAEKPEGDALGLLVQALDDDDTRVRGKAITALMETDGTEPLVAAMDSRHPDVRLQASVARAGYGDERALAPLVALASAPEPENSAEKQLWRERVVRSLEGLAELAHPDGLAVAAGLLDSPDAAIRRAAIRAVVWSSRPDDTAVLSAALRHQDKEIQRLAAAGLAFCGDPVGSSLLFEDKDSGRFQLALAAAVALGERAEDHFIGYLDSPDKALRQLAFLLMMMREAREGDGVPDRCLAALSSEHARTRLGAARALEAFHDPATFEDYLVELFLHRGHDPSTTDETPWVLDRQVVLDLADAITWGDPQLQARTVILLAALDEQEQDTFERRYAVFAHRNAAALSALRAEAAQRGTAGPRASASELRELVFGAYIGLSRQGRQAADARIRLTAIRRLAAMVADDRALLPAATPVFIQALRDTSQPVRALAFESLRDLGVDAALLGSEALSVGHLDVGVLGMTLLSSQGGSQDGQAVLERVMLEHDSGLELEAARLLAEARGWVPVYTRALEAASGRMRSAAVRGLGERIGTEAGAREALVGALRSRFRDVRIDAAIHLSSHGDGAAVEVLGELLQSDQHREQRQAIRFLTRLQDPRIPGMLLDRLENDPAGTALADDLIRAAGNFRDPAIADRLLSLLENSRYRRSAFSALRVISGYDQGIEDPEDEGTGEWLERQHPRDDALLTRLAEAVSRLGDSSLLRQLLPGLIWARSSVVDPLLTTLAEVPDNNIRRAVVIGIGWRIRKRGADVDPLLKALEHPDATTRFLAARELAYAGRREGLSILMTSIELLDDLHMRREAVLALGELADPQALDLLLRLATEDGHALQDVAAEALGHMSGTDRAERILQILSDYAQRDDNLGIRALRGLRYYGSPAAWRIVRQRLESRSWRVRQAAAKQLGYDEDPVTREVLADFLRTERDNDAAGAAAASLRRLYGADSLEPDFLFVQAAYGPLGEHTLERIAERADAGRILEVLPKIHPSQRSRYRDPLINILLGREPLPVAEAAAGLSSSDPGAVAVSARILGRAGADAGAHAEALSSAIERIGTLWRADLETLTGAASSADRARAAERIGDLSACLVELIWVCGRVGAGAGELVRLAAASGPAEYVRDVRRQALTALSTGCAGRDGLAALERAVDDSDPMLRALAASGLAALSAERAAAAAEAHLGDSALLGRLLASNAGSEVLRKGAASVHYQGAVLPHLVARGDSEGLAAVLADPTLPEPARLGAIEGLARIATEASVELIARFAKNESEDEELRKAAWRALRRARRTMARKQEVSA